MYKIDLNGKIFSLSEKTRIIDLIDEKEKRKYYCATVNNRLRELTYELSFDCEVKLLDLSTYDAVKVYETSLRYLLALAFYNVFPNYSIKISYNISRSLLVSILEPNNIIVNSELVARVENEMRRLIELDIPFIRTTISKEEAKEIFIKQKQFDKVDALMYRPEKVVHLSKCGDYLNYMYGYMVPSTGYLKMFNLFSYDNNIVVQYPRYEADGIIPLFDDQPRFSKALKKAHRWAKLCNADTASKINDHVRNDTIVDFINMCETKHNDTLAELGDTIYKDIENIRLICIAGPSSSGKTTFSNRLKIELMSKGIKPLRISLDMFYKQREECPKDENGEYDFEHIDALNIDLFNKVILGLINGEEVALPKFDFMTGEISLTEKVRIDSKTPIIIEGIHALNDKLTYAIPKHQKFKIYIAPQFQLNIDNHNPISYTDIRLLRRIVRDNRTRNTNAEETLKMWASVRRGEFRWIYPHQEGCDFVFNSELTYEIGVLKKYALPALSSIDSDSPYFIAANRLIKFIKYFNDVDDSYIPCNSLLREFIGGSCFKDA